MRLNIRKINILLASILLIIGFSINLYAGEENAAEKSELAEVKRQIELETSILKENPDAVPSPKLKELQKKAVQLQRNITVRASADIDNAAEKEASGFAAKAVEYKDNIKNAADGAISVINAMQDELDAESRALQNKINKITGNRDVYDFLSKAGNNSADAKKVRMLNSHLEKINERKSGIEKDKQMLTLAKSKLNGLKTGLDAMSMAKKFQEGKYLEGTEELLGIVKDYLPDNSGKIKALDATVKLLSETTGGTKKINQKLGKEMARLSEYSDKLKRVQKISGAIDTSLKTIGYLKQARDLVNKAMDYQKKLRELKDDGTTTKAGRNLIMGMDATGEAMKKLAGYLPSGASDFVEFYADAMKLPGTVNKVARKWYKDRDQAVNISGPLAQTRAGREYPGILDRDPELNPDGNLGVYYDPDKNQYILITDPDRPAIVISEKERNMLAKINSDLSAAGKKLTNSMIEKLRKNGYKKIVIPGVLKDETINVDDLAKIAAKKREEARIKMLASKALGIKNPSAKELARYKAFDDYINFSQRLHNYYLTEKQKQRLFAKYQEDPEGFRKFLDNYAKKNENTGRKPKLTKKEKKQKELEEKTKKMGIHDEDMKAFFNCLCRECGGSLGGFYNPSFKGPGNGPCQCNGPLTIWKTPIPFGRQAAIECFNYITKMNYLKNQVIFNKWHKAAIDANAKSVEKKVKKIKELIRTQRKNWEKETLEAAEKFNAIKDLIYPRDKDYMRSIITPRLINLAHYKMLEGNLDDAVRKLEIASTVGGKEKKIKADIAQYEKWKKPWQKVISKDLPEISKDAEKGRIVTAQKKLNRIYYKMSTQGGNLLPPINSHPEIISIQNKINKKSAHIDKFTGEILREIMEYENNSDPKSALKLIDNFPKDWEKGQNDIRRQRGRIVRKIQKAEEYAAQGDNFKKNKQYFKAISNYRASLKIQKDELVQANLDDLITSHKQAVQYQNKGNDCLKKQDIPCALSQYRLSLEIWPDPYLSKTISDLEKHLQNQKKAGELLESGRSLWNRGDLDGAMGKLRQASLLAPEDKKIAGTLNAMQKQKQRIDVDLGKAKDFIAKGKLSKAENFISDAATINDKYPEYRKVSEQLTNAKNLAAEKRKEEKNKKAQTRKPAEKKKKNPVSKPFYVSFAGKWQSNWGKMNFTQTENVFHGTYSHDQGQITGIVKGRTMYGTWTEAPSRKPPHDAGDIEFVLSKDGRKFTGRWRYGSNKNKWDGTWEGIKTEDAPNTASAEKQIISGTIKTSTSYVPNCKGDVFNGGHWAGARGGSDWIEKNFISPQLVSGIYIGRASTDITTNGFKLVLKLRKPDGTWIAIDELHNTNINRTGLSGGAKGKSIPSYTKILNPPLKATGFRLEFYGNGWFDATDIRIYTKE